MNAAAGRLVRARSEPASYEGTSRKPRRVLLLIWAGVLRGAERHVFDLASALPAYGYKPTICFFSRAHAYGPELRDAGIEFVELDNRNTKLDLRGMLRFMRLMRHGDFDIVHDHGVALWARPMVRLAAPGVPLVYTEHITRFTWLRRMLYRLLEPFTDAHIAVSGAARDALLHQLGVAPEAVEVVPNSVNPHRFNFAAAAARSETKLRLELPPDSFVLCAVGRLTASKQFDVLIRCVGDLLRRRDDVHLIVIGEGEERDALTTDIAVAGLAQQIHLIGARLDIPEILCASDVFVFASREESFGIAVAEAMLAGLPVVALRIPGVAEVVDHGVTGILVEQTKTDTAFAGAVEELLTNNSLRERFGIAGRNRALSLFSPARMASRVVAIYDALIRPGSVGTD